MNESEENQNCLLFDGSVYSIQETDVVSFTEFEFKAGNYPYSYSSTLLFTVNYNNYLNLFILVKSDC